MTEWIKCPECGRNLPKDAWMCDCCGISMAEIVEILDEYLLEEGYGSDG